MILNDIWLYSQIDVLSSCHQRGLLWQQMGTCTDTHRYPNSNTYIYVYVLPYFNLFYYIWLLSLGGLLHFE